MYAFSGEEITYDNFFPSEPSNGPLQQEDCITLKYFANKWRWHDWMCSDTTNYYICEKEPYLLTR